MVEMTPEQRQALALAQARLRIKSGEGTTPAAVPEAPGVVEDVVKSAAAGAGKGLLSVPGIAGDVADIGSRAADWATEKLFGKDSTVQAAIDKGRQYTAYSPPTTAGLQKYVEKATGEFHEPQTRAGRYARTGAEFMAGGAAAAPKRIAAGALKFGLAPGLASEAAGEALEGTKYEPYARVAAALVGAGGADQAHKAMVEAFHAPTGALSSVPKSAVRYAETTVADPARRAAMEAEMKTLGPDAMLADVSPHWTGIAHGAATHPNQRDTVVNALVKRDDARNQRLGADLDRTLGPAPVPSHVEAGLKENRKALGPEYDAVMANAKSVDTQDLADNLDAMVVNLRGPGQGAARKVRDMLNVVGDNPEKILDPHPGTLLQTRQAIDGLMEGEVNSQVLGVLERARKAVDEKLAIAAPGVKDVDAKYAELKRQSEGLKRGSMVLDSGKTAIRPVEMAAEMAEGALPQGTMVGPSAEPKRIQQGTRAEIDRVVGTKANDPAALQSLVKSEGDWNRDKMRTVFGEERADDALNAIDREKRFYTTGGRVTAGSDTEVKRRFGAMLEDMSTPPKIPAEASFFGSAARSVQKVGQAMMGRNAEANAARFAEALGALSVAQGPERDILYKEIVDSLMRRQARTGGESRALGLALAGSAPVRGETSHTHR